MRFLVDTNLPPAVAEWLVAQGFDAEHTSAIGLEKAADRVIWERARQSGSCIVTKDEDFVLLHAADPSGPSVVWVRIGNAVRRIIVAKLAEVWPSVMAKLEQGEPIVEVR